MSDGALFRYVPLSAGRELFLPLEPAAATAGGFALYAPITRTARAYRNFLFLASRLGLAAALLRTKTLNGSPATRHLQDNRILDVLMQALKRPDARFAVYQGKEAIVRKPTILAMERSGAPLAYAKIGWNASTRKLIEREHETLRLLGRHELRFGRVARVLGYLDMDHTRILLSEPLQSIRSAPDFTLTPLHVAFLKEVGLLTLRRARLADSAFWRRMTERLAELRQHMQPNQIDTLEAGMAMLERRLDCEDLPWVLRLGDFMPWNFGIDPATHRVEVVDLEFAEQESLVGWDIFHFLIGVKSQFQALDLTEQLRSKPFCDYFEQFRVRLELLPYLQLAYLLDLAIFFRHMWRDRPLTPGAQNNQGARLEAIARVTASLAS